MSTLTENYFLIKPDEEDYYDVQKFNENFDIIDSQMAETAALAEAVGASAESINQKIGTPEDTDSSTIFGKLNSGSGFIKSIQVVEASSSYDGSVKELALQPVDPSRCIILSEKLLDSSSGQAKTSYVLSSDNLTVTFHNKVGYSAHMRYQIIELY